MTESSPDEPARSATGSTEWEAELERRAAEVEAGTAPTLTLEEYRAHVEQRRADRARRPSIE